MWVRRAAQLMALFGLYSLGLAAIGARYNGHGTSGYTTGLIELAVVTVLLVVLSAFVLTRKPRPKPPLDQDE
ncbi:MAG TPA: hypothetical protein VFL29_14685 [Candidatus Dormibacteraeota bacterium]|nr:hypothetical protein [Candidatus Dormibacteraeota bacterium]